MTPQDTLDIETATNTIRRIVEENNGCLFLMATTPTVGVLPEHLGKIIVSGEENTIKATLEDSCLKNQVFFNILMDTALQLASLKNRNLTALPQKEATITHLAQLRDMKAYYPDASPYLKMLENHFRNLLKQNKLSA